jgi:hypothetical protein
MTGQITTSTCSTCDERIEACEFCQREECGSAVCYECLNEALGQGIHRPHDHGG